MEDWFELNDTSVPQTLHYSENRLKRPAEQSGETRDLGNVHAVSEHCPFKCLYSGGDLDLSHRGSYYALAVAAR